MTIAKFNVHQQHTIRTVAWSFYLKSMKTVGVKHQSSSREGRHTKIFGGQISVSAACQQHALPATSVLDQGCSACVALCPTTAQLPLPAEMTVRLLIHVE